MILWLKYLHIFIDIKPKIHCLATGIRRVVPLTDDIWPFLRKINHGLFRKFSNRQDPVLICKKVWGGHSRGHLHTVVRARWASIQWFGTEQTHYFDVIMGTMASQITSLAIVYSIVYSGTYQRKHQSSASLAFVWGIHRWPVNSPHKGPVTRKMFPFDDVIVYCVIHEWQRLWCSIQYCLSPLGKFVYTYYGKVNGCKNFSGWMFQRNCISTVCGFVSHDYGNP